LLVLLLAGGSALSQPLTKVIANKFPNGKPETVNYYQGETIPQKLTKQERFSMDGRKVLERNYKNGILHGISTEWKEFDGTKVAELNYDQGVLSGQQSYFFSDGTPKMELNYLNGKLDGRQVEYWFRKGRDTLRSEHHYSAGILHGMQRQWTKEGRGVYNLHFVAGKPDGIQRVWDDTGAQKEEKWKQGVFEEWLENWTASQPRHARIYDYVPRGDSLNVAIGKSLQKEVWYYETGAVEALTTTNNDKETETQVFYLGGKLKGKGKGSYEAKAGKWEYYHPNGKKMMTGEYRADKQAGLFERWDENGNLVAEEFWNPDGSGRETWKIYTYYPAGGKESEGTLDPQGHKKGKWKYWHASGNKMREEDWDDACTSGKGRPSITNLSVWDDGGHLVTKGSETQQQSMAYYPNGNPSEITTKVFPKRDVCGKGPVDVFKEGRFTMEEPGNPDYNQSVIAQRISFFETGDTSRIDRWNLEGKRDGYQAGWFPDGKKQYEYHYSNGNVQGSVKEWYPTGQMMLDHKYSSATGTPSLQEGTYYTDKGKAYPYSAAEGKKKKTMEEIDAACLFQKFWRDSK
jgi:antitoxin component YwqK of YwqJK toxin-antitoxin module